MNVDSPISKKVRFMTSGLYPILDNLYVSDQISSFDQELLESKQITILINLTKSAPFLSKKTKNTHYHFFNEVSCTNETIQKINHAVHDLFTQLSHNETVLLYCENGYTKASILLGCFLMKYYDSDEIIEIDHIIRFIKWKTKYELTETSPYYSVLKQYRNFLQGKMPIESLKRQVKKQKVVSIIKNHFIK